MQKILFFILLALGSSIQTHAQQTDSIPTKKIGVKFQNFDRFGLIYKIKLDQHYLRIEALNMGSRITRSVNPDQENFPLNSYEVNLGFNIGVEKDWSLSERLAFLHGYSLVSGVGFEKRKSAKEIAGEGLNISLGVGYILGVNYKITKVFEVTAEIMPDLRYHYEYTKDHLENRIDKSYTHRFDLDINNHAKFSILYNF